MLSQTSATYSEEGDPEALERDYRSMTINPYR